MVGSLGRVGGEVEARALFVSSCIIDEIRRLDVLGDRSLELFGDALTRALPQGGLRRPTS